MPKVLIPIMLEGPWLDALRQAGLDLILPENGRSMKRKEILDKVTPCEGMVAAGGFATIDAQLMDAAPNLKIVSYASAGYDTADVAAATGRGVLITNAPRPTTEATADIAFGLMLDAMRGISHFDRLMRRDTKAAFKASSGLYGRPLEGATVGILGMGRIGQAVARRAKAARMTVLYHARRPVSLVPATLVTLEDLFSLSDAISIHCPLTEQTRGLVDARLLGLMKPSAYLVNTARGAVVDEAALIDALANNRIAGAGLDVYAGEPQVPEALLQMEQVVLCPHIGTSTRQTRALMALNAAEHLIQYFAGQTPEDLVNPQALLHTRTAE